MTWGRAEWGGERCRSMAPSDSLQVPALTVYLSMVNSPSWEQSGPRCSLPWCGTDWQSPLVTWFRRLSRTSGTPRASPPWGICGAVATRLLLDVTFHWVPRACQVLCVPVNTSLSKIHPLLRPSFYPTFFILFLFREPTEHHITFDFHICSGSSWPGLSCNCFAQSLRTFAQFPWI